MKNRFHSVLVAAIFSLPASMAYTKSGKAGVLLQALVAIPIVE
jgi:hypothetical protein